MVILKESTILLIQELRLFGKVSNASLKVQNKMEILKKYLIKSSISKLMEKLLSKKESPLRSLMAIPTSDLLR
jgi:hypothetical protein